MLTWQVLNVSAPPNPNHVLGYAALIAVGMGVVITLLVTLITLVLHNLHEEERRRHTR